MNFLYPQVLWFLSALSIPIIIHLFHFRKVRIIEFSSIKFIEAVKDDTKRKRNLKHLLILFCRLMFLTFLILAFAQPFSEIEKTNSKNTILFLDNSYSMSNEAIEGGNSLEMGIEFINSYLGAMPLENRVFFLTNNFNNNLNEPEFKSIINEKLTELTFNATSRSIKEVILKIDPLDDFQLFYISDFQKSTFGNLPEINGKLKLVPIQYSQTQNIFIDTVYFEEQILLFDRNNLLHVVLKNVGDYDANDIQIKLFNENRQLSTTSVEINQNDTYLQTFEIDPKNLTSNLLKIEIDDYPIIFDNEYWIALTPLEKTKIVYIYSQTQNIFINEVYQNKELFDFESFSFSNIEYSKLSNAHLIILDDFESLPESVINATDKYTDFLVVPPKKINLASYNQFFDINIEMSNDTLFTDMQQPDLNDPFFNNIFEKNKNNSDLPKVKLNLKIKQAHAILKTSFDDYILIQKTKNNNNLYLFANPLTPDYTNLTSHALFLPIFYRVAQFSSQIPEPLSYSADKKTITFSSSKIQPEKLIKIVGPNNNEFVPDYHISGNTITLEFPPNNLEIGYYHVMSIEDTLKTLAINHSKIESDIRQMNEDELKNTVNDHPNIEILNFDSARDFSVFIQESFEGVRLWKYCLMIALSFLLFEMLIIRFF